MACPHRHLAGVLLSPLERELPRAGRTAVPSSAPAPAVGAVHGASALPDGERGAGAPSAWPACARPLVSVLLSRSHFHGQRLPTSVWPPLFSGCIVFPRRPSGEHSAASAKPWGTSAWHAAVSAEGRAGRGQSWRRGGGAVCTGSSGGTMGEAAAGADGGQPGGLARSRWGEALALWVVLPGPGKAGPGLEAGAGTWPGRPSPMGRPQPPCGRGSGSSVLPGTSPFLTFGPCSPKGLTFILVGLAGTPEGRLKRPNGRRAGSPPALPWFVLTFGPCDSGCGEAAAPHTSWACARCRGPLLPKPCVVTSQVTCLRFLFGCRRDFLCP